MPWLSESLDAPRSPCSDIVSSSNNTEPYFNYLQLRSFNPCTSCFVHHCDQVPDKVNLKGTESCSQLEGVVHQGREVMAAGTARGCSNSNHIREAKSGVALLNFSPFGIGGLSR